jgi:hypothetical protein
MGNLFNLLNNPPKSELPKYLKGITKSVDIENCRTMVNTFVEGVNFTGDKLIQYCISNNIPYFTRGEYDVFTLEEVEYIINDLNTLKALELVFDDFKKKFPKRHIDMSLEQFKKKLLKLDLIKDGEELNKYMRYTNDTVEYVRRLGTEHTIEECLEIIKVDKPELSMTADRLNEMKDRYLIKFVKDEGMFTESQIEMIKVLARTETVKNTYLRMRELYGIPCGYLEFIEQISRLKALSIYNIGTITTHLTPFEEAYIEELLVSEDSNAVLYSKFNKAFPNKYQYLQFVKYLNEIKTSKYSNNESTNNDKYKDLEKLLESFKGEKTIQECLDEAQKDERFKDCNYKSIYNFIHRRNIPFKQAKKGRVAGTKNIDKKDKTVSRAKGRKSILDDIYDDLVETLSRVSIPKTIIELKERYPEKADRLSYGLIMHYAKNHNIKTKKETPEERQDRMNKMRGIRGTKKQEQTQSKDGKVDGRQELSNKIYDDLKSLCKDYTKMECLNIIRKKYNVDYTETYIPNLMNRKGKLKFKVYTEFTDDMKKTISELEGTVGNKVNLYRKFAKVYPGAVSLRQFCNMYNDMEKASEEDTIHNTDTIGVSADEIESKPIVEPVTEHIDTIPVKEEEHTEFVESIQQKQPVPVEKYQPIIDEVNATFERKCRQLGVSEDTHQHTDEIIKALGTIIQYADSKKLNRILNDHEDILEQYRREVEHEIEIEPWSDGDSYCHNKLKAIGMRRREVKYARDDINVMKELLDNINTNIELYKKTLEDLEEKKLQRENSIFIPLVDSSMVDRLDWCKHASLRSKRAYTPILTTNAKEDRIKRYKAQGDRDLWVEKEQTQPVFQDNVSKSNKNSHLKSTYRVKAEFMVLKGNPFVNKYYDVVTTNEDLAKDKAIEYFDLISSNNNNAKYQIVSVTRLNR